MSGVRAPAEVVPCPDAPPEESHWTGVAMGGFFELVLFFDGLVYARAQVTIPLARTMDGEIVCRDPAYAGWRTRPGGNSFHHVQLWARRHFTPPPRDVSGKNKPVKQSCLGFTPIHNSRASFLTPAAPTPAPPGRRRGQAEGGPTACLLAPTAQVHECGWANNEM